MKKILLIAVAFLIIGCSKEENIVNENKTPSNNTQVNIVDFTPDYIDNNPVKISIYAENDNGTLYKVGGKYETTWIQKKDIVVLAALPTDIESPEYDYMQNMWPKYDKEYNGYTYKVGWNVSFKLQDGKMINTTVSKPSDVEYFYDYLEIYLYDDVNVPIGQWHSHLLDEELTEKTIMDAIKLTAGSKYEEISGPISITVFTYDDNEDFDENGNYRGNSFYKVEVYNN